MTDLDDAPARTRRPRPPRVESYTDLDDRRQPPQDEAAERSVLGGMLLEPGPGRLRFSHDLVRDTLYGDIPQLRRARLHAAAHAILTRRRPDDPVPLAHHALAAGSAVEPGRALAAVRAAAAAETADARAVDTAVGGNAFKIPLVAGTVTATLRGLAAHRTEAA